MCEQEKHLAISAPWPSGLTDKASAFKTEDCVFVSHLSQLRMSKAKQPNKPKIEA